MPSYRVWYRDITEPLVFDAAGRCSDREILEHILENEQIGAGADAGAPTVQELIARHHLAPVRYTEDESEIITIDA